MTVSDRQISRIKAIMQATDEVLEKAGIHNNKECVSLAKETAYDHIKGIIEDPGYCPWAE